MSNLNSLQSSVFGPELSALIEAHARPGCMPNLQSCLTALTEIDRQVFEYCGRIEALMTAMAALLDTAAAADASGPLRHLMALAGERASLCREFVTSAVEETGLQSVDEVTA